jgi:hypothetical protein
MGSFVVFVVFVDRAGLIFMPLSSQGGRTGRFMAGLKMQKNPAIWPDFHWLFEGVTPLVHN